MNVPQKPVMDLEDRLSKATREYYDTLDGDAQINDVIASLLCEISAVATDMQQLMLMNKVREPKSGVDWKESVIADLVTICDHALIVLGALDVNPPQGDDILAMVENFHENIVVDGVLSTAVISRGANEALMVYFTEEDLTGVAEEDFMMAIGEIFAGASMLFERLGTTIEDQLWTN